jgi:hypothetical protein
MLSIENFESVSSNWGQLVLFNKMIIYASFEYLINSLHTTKNPSDVKRAMKCHTFYPLAK